MKKKLLVVFTVLILMMGSAALVGCGNDSSGGEKSEGAGGKITLSNDATVTYEGKTMTIDIAENATTGYVWSATIDDGAVLELTQDEYTPDESKEGATGVGGIRNLEFTAQGAGDTTVTFELAQDWDGGEQAKDETFVLNVAVDKEGTITSVTEA